jgi:hypothetical protein
MNARGLIAVAASAGLVLVSTVVLWPARTVQSTPAPNTPPPNTNWTRAAALNSPTELPYSGTDPGADGENPSSSPGAERSQGAPLPEGHEVSMQDGTVIWAAERERAGSTPARER